MPQIKVTQDTVQFQEKLDSPWNPLTKGTIRTIVKGNRIQKTDDSGRIAVDCGGGFQVFNNLSTVNEPFALSDLCSAPVPQSSENNEIPFIYIPRKTSLLSNQPIIRWNKVTDATTYTIELIDKDANKIWTQDVDSSDVCQGGICKIDYSGTPLETNQIHNLIITTDTGRSTEESVVPNTGFQVIVAARALEINQKINDIKNLGLSNTEQGLKISEIYEQNNLIAEAILILENLSDVDKTSDVYCQLGEFYYYYLDLPIKGAELLQTAINKATDIKQAAVAQIELAELKIIFGKKDEAKALLEESLNKYTTLGAVEHQDHIDYINQKLKQLLP
ncbi:lipopolysaccharide assembly protein LapB [Anabaena sp. PCC 7108]|uniref:tetratricopeptide repeat protein n=1 Tax=Anabaena sp. PCC 7108 TaxID=163908 RepID=UPI00034DB738|nr:tetratricopeptide repeat protein [Anabaena sp. PCC 7108]